MCGCLALVIVAAAAVSWFVWGQDVSSRQIEDLIGSWGMWGVFGSICLMVVHSFVPFPAGTKLVTLPVWYNVKVMAHTVIPDQPAPDTGIMAWSRYLSELEKLPRDDEGVRLAIQGARDMIAELEWLEPEGPKKPS
jgi:hypothetical protein